MPRNTKKLLLFMFPIGCLVLAVGWVLYYFGSKTCSPSANAPPVKQREDGLTFGVLLPEEQLLRSPVAQVKSKAAKQVKPRFQWLRHLI